ncbi:unnamed protein product [Blepharisma stoltei]|uniref:Uncharacterized protein n=1 Tax=Blepharisma stoltei TaxID=1481888 RepID=A0AAU9JV04_9CILI|nr:unnamed protein product [Blepharisma stoltei]
MEDQKLKKTAGREQAIKHFQEEGYERELRKVMVAIYNREKDSEFSVKDGMKYCFEKIMNEIWKENEAWENSKNHHRVGTSESSDSSAKKIAKPKLVETSSTSTLKKSSGSLFLRSEQEIASFSEFSQTPKGSFGRAKRMNYEVKNPTPGPAAYRVDDSLLKSKSPKAVMPSGGKRFNFVINPDTPGPNQYYPSRRCVSKF